MGFIKSTVERSELTFNNNGKRIWGEIYKPKNSNTDGRKYPTIIFSHGYNSSAGAGTNYATAFAEAGYVTYCFDFAGGSTFSRSDGKSTDMSIFTEQQDLNFVLDSVKELDYVDHNKIYLFGESQGGMVSTMVATDRPDEVAGLFMIYPAYVIAEDAKNSYGSIENVPNTINFMGLKIGKEYYKDLFDFDIYSKMENYKKDVLIVHGDRDGLVDISYSIRATKVFPSSTLKVIPGAGHGFYGASEERAIEFFKGYLRTH